MARKSERDGECRRTVDAARVERAVAPAAGPAAVTERHAGVSAVSARAAGGRRSLPDPRVLVRVLFDCTDPRAALKEAAAVYATLAGRNRRLELASTTRNASRVRVVGPASGRDACLLALGFFRRAVELASGTRVQAEEVRCAEWGDGCCEFSYRYDPEEAQA